MPRSARLPKIYWGSLREIICSGIFNCRRELQQLPSWGRVWTRPPSCKGCIWPDCKRETWERSPERSTDGRTSEDWRGQTKDRGGLAKAREGAGRVGERAVPGGLEPQARGWWRNARGGWVRDWGRRMSRSPLQPGRTSGVTESVGIYIRRGSLHFAIVAVHI